MRQLLSVIMAVVLVCAVGGSLASGTMASFLDTEVTTNNYMCAGSRLLDLSGGIIAVTHAMPSVWYSEEYTLINTGTLDGMVILYIPLEDDPGGEWKGLESVEAGAVGGQIWDGTVYRDATGAEPIGFGVATSETELVAEEGGQVGQTIVSGLGTDAGGDNGPPAWVMSKHVDFKGWFDEDGDGNFTGDELIVDDKLFNVAGTEYEMGIIPAALTLEKKGDEKGAEKGGGWGSYFDFNTGASNLEMPLVAGQNRLVGMVSLWNDAHYLYVEYDTTASGWGMDETHLYVGEDPPIKMAPGKFPYKHSNLGGATTDNYKIALDEIGMLCIAVHAAGDDRETAWAQGVARNLKIEVHLPQIEDPAWDGAMNVDYDLDGDVDEDDATKRWWPTGAFQGDKCIFDMVFRIWKP
ncbi:hypothetical protein ACFLYG_03170 [Chloroflexota bacterium]